MTLKQNAILGTFWSAVQLVGQQIISLLLFIVLARLLRPDDFGVVSLGFTFIAFIQVFLDQGFSAAIIQLDKLDDVHLSTAFWVNLLFGVSMTALTIMNSQIAAQLFGNPSLGLILIGLSPIFTIQSLTSVQEAILKRNLDFRPLAIRTLFGTISGGIVGVGMALAGFGAWSLVGMQLVTRIVATLILWFMSSFVPKLLFSMAAFRQLFNFGKHVIGTGFVDYFNRNADDLLIGYFLGTTALGYYTIAYRIVRMIVSLLTGVINTVAFPLFSRMQNDIPRVRASYYIAVQLTVVFAFPVFIGLALVAPEFVRLFYGVGWEPSTLVMQVLALIGVLHAAYYFNTSVLLAAGKPFWRFLLSTISTIVNVMAFLFAVRWGIVAVAVAYVVGSYFFAPFPLMAVKRLIKIEYSVYLRLFGGPLIASIAMTIAVLVGKYLLWSRMSDVEIIMVSFVVGALVYGLLIHLTVPALLSQIQDMIRHLISPKQI